MDEAAKADLDAVDILKLLEYLPHRYPFLLVDRIDAIRGDESCVGIKNVRRSSRRTSRGCRACRACC